MYKQYKKGIKQESTNYRPQSYSIWHRTLDKNCYAIDIDFVEYRLNRGIVGIFETKEFINKEDLLKKVNEIVEYGKFQRKVLKLLTIDTIYDAYVVFHTRQMDYFLVWNINKFQNPNWIQYNQEEYKMFIENL